MKKIAGSILFTLMFNCAFAQEEPVLKGLPNIRKISSGGNKDTIGFEHRNDLKDSINISYKYLDSTNKRFMDSSVNDFDKYYPVPSSYQYLGNNGAAAFPLIFQPFVKPGWDAGFHAYDIYRFTLEDSKFYKTTRPFSMLGYQLASGKEQMIRVMHTQNPRPNLNVGFDYRLITAPGFFITQNTNHNNFRLYGNYQGKRKRYNSYLVLVGNKIRASENGGIKDDSLLLDPNKKDRFSIPVNMGNSASFKSNPFVTTINTGNTYRDFTLFLRQSYDLGKRDSVEINDSTTDYLFYPKLRIQHSFTYSTYSYTFNDIATDSALYQNWYDTTLKAPKDTFTVKEKWSVMSNDLSLIQFPDTKNSAQFILAGATLQNLKGEFYNSSSTFYNVMLHGEYRNRTRNKLWDLLIKGEFYIVGLNTGDYSAYATLGRYLNKKLGNVSLFFQNVNRTPSFIFDNRSSFNLGNNNHFNKENITSFGATATNPFFNIGFKDHLITNYCYFSNYYKTAQYSKLINLLQISASKKVKISRHWNWYAEVVLQQTDGAAPVKVPFLFTRNRLAYEGNFYKNLNLSAGIEARYYTAYKANNYSPVMGQFVPQDTVTIKNLPDISAFVHFRIKGFTAYIRAENLNTISTANGFGFINNNFAAPHFPTQGFMLRLGIQWWFVN
ncbi:MAG: putative porin [Ferruginibacter sp.]